MANICTYIIGHTPDRKYFKPLLESLKGFATGVFYLNTDGIKETAELFKSNCVELGIPCRVGNILMEKENFHFGEARNKSLRMAREGFCWSCDWFMWLDCDDIVINGEEILKEMDSNTIGVYDLVYDVEGAGKFTRERIVHKRVQGEWVNRVHEVWDIDKTVNRELISSGKIKHMKEIGNDSTSHDFHISLCKKALENAPNYYLYIGKEYFNSTRLDEAKQFLEHGEQLTECILEKYNANITLHKIACNNNDPVEAKSILLKALSIDSRRREAYYYLAVLETTCKNFEIALGYIRACCALPKLPMGLQEDSIYEGGSSLVLMYRLLSRLCMYEEAFAVSVELIKGLNSRGVDIDVEISRESRVLQILSKS